MPASGAIWCVRSTPSEKFFSFNQLLIKKHSTFQRYFYSANAMVLIKHDAEYYRQRKPQPDLGAIQNFKRFLWDPERRAFLDRTAREWMNVGIFYLCFYTVLFSFTAFQLWITYKSVACSDKPYFNYDRVTEKAWLEPSRRNMPAHMNQHGPGVVFKPNILKNGHSPRILIDESKAEGKPQKYIKAIEELLANYKVDKSKFDEKCSSRSLHDEADQKPCFFDISSLGKCAKSPFGYTGNSPQPCVYVKFNKRFGWLPIFYNKASVLPNDMPEWLQKIIQKSDQFHVWLSCEGKSQEEKAKLGEIEYLPKPGFPVQYFPFEGQKNYLAPVVALRFKNLPVNQQVAVECKTWARNIDNADRYNLNFKIMIKK